MDASAPPTAPPTDHSPPAGPPRPGAGPPRPADPDGPDPSRTGAIWVTGTGAFLLLAAAAVFVAVRWEEIPAAAKLAALAALTGAFLLAGRRLRPVLPATAGALFHLGAFLVPVDVAALAVRAELSWEVLLLLEGLVCALTFTLAARAERSIVLRWGAVAGLVLAAGGIGATTAVPAPVALAGAAAAALAARRDGDALPLALVAGLGPLTGFALAGSGLAPGVLEQLGLAGSLPRVAGLVAGGASALVLGTLARRRLDPALAYLAAACAVSGAAVSGADALDPMGWSGVVGACALLAVVDAVALLARHDPFWSGPSDRLALVAEGLALPASLAAATALLLAPLVTVHSPEGAVAAALVAATWVTADLRRRAGTATPVTIALLLGGRLPLATVGIGSCIPAAALLATGSGPVAAVALVVTAAVLLSGGRPLAAGAAAVMSTLAPLTTLGHPEDSFFSSGPTRGTTDLRLACAVAVGVAGSMLLARAVRWRSDLDLEQRRPAATGTWLLALAALGPLAAAGAIAADTRPPGTVLVVTALLAWLVALVADPARGAGGATPGRHLGPAAAIRFVGLVLVLGTCDSVGTRGALVVATLVAALVVLDACRLDEPVLALGLVGALPVLTVAGGQLAELSTARTGVGIALAAVVVGGITSILPGRWLLAGGASAGVLAALGLLLASSEQTALADALLVEGAAMVAVGASARRSDVAMAGGVGLTLGTWARLIDADVSISEPYLVPVVVLLLLAGWQGRATASSWVSTGPSLALLGGSALAERVAGGSGGHALLAGVLGVVAVAAGGRWRLAAPLVLGTGLLVALAVHESLGVTASVPTWAWLALGGTTLLGAGVLLERAQLGPLESGRRLVDVVQERFR